MNLNNFITVCISVMSVSAISFYISEKTEIIRRDMNNIQKSLGKNKILILPAYEIIRYNMMLLKNKLSNFRFTNISEEFLEFPSSRTTGLSQRFFAYVNNQGRMTSFYFPSKNQQDITRLYLNHLKEKIQKNNKNKIVGHK